MEENEIEKILEDIDFDARKASLFEMHQKVLNATLQDAEKIIDDLNFWEKAHSVGHDRFENQPYYYLFKAYVYEVLFRRSEAIDFASRAASLFRMLNMQWNEALVHWFLGILYDRDSHKEDSCKELQTATAILEGMARGFQRQGHVTNCLECQVLLHQLYRYISQSKSEEHLIAATDKSDKGYLLPAWMPVYEKVQRDDKANIMWAQPSGNNGTEIQLISIGGQWYSIKSVRPHGGKIILDRDREYGWAKVWGDDMNAAQPIAIEEGDYILFIKQGEVVEDELVIASCWKDEKKKEYSHMVRKLGKKIHDGNILYSESTEMGDRYQPIPVGEETQILGYVVAVAKPIKLEKQGEKPPPESPQR